MTFSPPGCIIVSDNETTFPLRRGLWTCEWIRPATFLYKGIISAQQGRGTYVRQRPDAGYLARVRREKLHSLLSRLLVQAFSLGYRPDEVQIAFAEELQSWLQQNPAPAGSLSAEREEGQT
ncbi:MAG: hypothetical protein IT330_07350 [Anaerolineae bacterium]|nr:hypothetical protein [Anaerolineae bacterium]